MTEAKSLQKTDDVTLVKKSESCDSTEKKRKKKRRLAVLLFGVRFSSVKDNGENLRKHILDKWDADVFVCGQDSFDGIKFLRQILGERIVAINLEKQMSEEQIRALMGAR